MKVAMIGAGYVGLVSGAGFAEIGHDVAVADVDTRRIGSLREGRIPIYEPGLEELVRRNAAEGRLSFTSEVAKAVSDADIVFVAVGTPSRGDGGADLGAVFAVAETVAAHARKDAVVALKSTVPVGTNARVRRIVGPDIQVVSNPEFLKEGEAVDDFLRPDRVVVGVSEGDARARDVVERLYKPLRLEAGRIFWMEPASAELTKYVANTMLAMRISFMNEIAGLCEAVGADVHDVRLGVGSDARIGPRFLYAGPGYGGSCFPKDVRALVDTAREHGLELQLAVATHLVNERQKGLMLRRLRKAFGGDLRGRRVAVWGAAFKPRTDDLRESPALTLIDGLLSEGVRVAVHDPAARDGIAARYGGSVDVIDDPYDAASGAEALVLATEWDDYRNPDFGRLAQLMARPFLLDGRNVWSGRELAAAGFTYEGIGVRVARSA
jgi:UDPglucose 6-dehydrogenase